MMIRQRFWSPYFKKKIPDLSVRVGNSSITPSVTARNIGVIFDNTLQMKSDVSDICKRDIYQIKAIASNRCYISQQACDMPVHGFITSKLDYCNSLLAGLPKEATAHSKHCSYSDEIKESRGNTHTTQPPLAAYGATHQAQSIVDSLQMYPWLGATISFRVSISLYASTQPQIILGF